MRKLWNLLCFAALCGVIAGCAAEGQTANPIGRALSWYSYVGGEDIRAKCTAGSLDMVRLVYNGRYMEQVRTYDLTADVIGPGATFLARANGRTNIAALNLSDPLGNWRGAVYQHFISPEQRQALLQGLDASGFGRPAPKGLFLRSDWFYWAVSACRNGVFHFYAWQQPDDDLAKLAFLPVLLGLDKTGAEFNAPREVYVGPFDPSPRAGNVSFQLEVGANGLVLGPSF